MLNHNYGLVLEKCLNDKSTAWNKFTNAEKTNKQKKQMIENINNYYVVAI